MLAVFKDYVVFKTTKENIDGGESGVTDMIFTSMFVSFLLEDLGQVSLQVNYYEQFTNKLDVFALVNAIIMVSLTKLTYIKS